MAVKRAARFGYRREVLSFPFIIPSGTSSFESMTDWLPGFTGTVEQVDLVVTNVVGAGAGASRALRLVRTRGSTDTDIATGTVVLAEVNTLGAKKSMTLSTTPANLDFVDDDKFSIMGDAAGAVTYTTPPQGTMLVVVRAQPQQKS